MKEWDFSVPKGGGAFLNGYQKSNIEQFAEAFGAIEVYQ